MVIDELITFFLAGMKTIQASTTNLIIYMELNPSIKADLLAEILPAAKEAQSNMVEQLDYERVMEFELLQRCFYESLRIEPPVPVSGAQCMNQDVTINKVAIKRDTLFFISIYSLHHDPTQWRSPEKFEPARFDAKSEWYKTPSGDARNPLTFSPFLGGKRVCLGKTFAEVMVRFTVPLLYHHFDFKLTNPDHLKEKPKYHIAATVNPIIPVRLTIRTKA